MPAQALPAAIGPASYVAVGVGASTSPSDYNGRHLGGAMAFVDIQPTWRLGFEGEARSMRYNTDEGVTQTEYFAGLRVATSPERLRPYAKFLVGATRIEAPFHYGHGTFFTLVPGGGVDYLLTNRICVRVVDLEYRLVPSFLGTTSRNVGMSTGVSFRLNDFARFPKSRRVR